MTDEQMSFEEFTTPKPGEPAKRRPMDELVSEMAERIDFPHHVQARRVNPRTTQGRRRGPR